MKRVLPLGLLCSLVVSCLALGTEGQDISSIRDARESSVVSSLLPESQGSTYLLAFPVDEASSNDHSEQVHAGGGGTSESVTVETSPDEKEGKEEVMTVMLNAGDPKEEEKNDVMIPIQDLQPKEEAKFFPPPFIPFRNKPTYRERKFPFPSPFQKLRPTFLPPMRNLLQSLRREPPINKMPPLNFLGAASLIRRALSSRLRMLNDRYQAPVVMEEKLVPLPVSPPPEPVFPLPHSPMPMFMPLPETAEPTFMPPLSPLHPLFIFNAPSFMPPPLPLHRTLLLPPFMHPFPIAPTPFMFPPPPPPFLYHSFPPRRMFHLPPPMPLYHPPPLFPPLRFSSPPLPPPPPFMQHPPHHIEMPEPLNVPSHEPPYVRNLQMHLKSQREPEEVVLIPSQEETPSSEEPSYVLLYPSETEMPQTEMTSKKRSLLDLLRPKAGKVRHVIQQTRIITHYKPDLTGLFRSLEPPSSFHKPIFRINDI